MLLNVEQDNILFIFFVFIYSLSFFFPDLLQSLLVIFANELLLVCELRTNVFFFYATLQPELWLHLLFQRLRLLNCIPYVVPLNSIRKRINLTSFISLLMIILLHFTTADTLWHSFMQLQLMYIASFLSALVSETLIKILCRDLAFKFLTLWLLILHLISCYLGASWNWGKKNKLISSFWISNQLWCFLGKQVFPRVTDTTIAVLHPNILICICCLHFYWVRALSIIFLHNN